MSVPDDNSARARTLAAGAVFDRCALQGRPTTGRRKIAGARQSHGRPAGA